MRTGSTFHHKQVLGGLGHDAVLLYDQAGAGGGWVYMTAGAYFIELDGQEVPNAILESLAQRSTANSADEHGRLTAAGHQPHGTRAPKTPIRHVSALSGK